MSNLTPSSPPPLPAKAPGGAARRIGDVWQWLGISGDAVGTSGILRRTFFYAFGVAAVLVGAINALNMITDYHDLHHIDWREPLIWEGSSWITLMAVFWITWVGYRLAPPFVRPRWRLLVHVPLALAFSLAHVVGFLWLRELAYWLAGGHYDFGDFWPTFAYELRKDGLGYCLFQGGFALIEHLLRQQQLIATPGQTLTFDIRDGARLTRVQLAQITAVASAGNYVEFVLRDGRRLLMRSPLSAVEEDLSPRGFVRTHRSWLVNGALVTGLCPEGSGDYTVTLPDLSVPLSRRYKAALGQLRGGG
ncbi:MAG: response regulator transcription factor [Alphaproteobacteria bacterium]|nr:response regulator transcription factor [Alphaproteobacteria bacterium]